MMVEFASGSIVKQIETSLQEGDIWIPEQIILSLLSEWILEENKSLTLYPFLNDIDYLKLLSHYENARNNEKKNSLRENVIEMYKISSSMIKRLKNSKYRVDTSRKSKKRNK